MTISEFAVSRGIAMQTVSIYIARHPDQFAGHTKKSGKTVELDEKALEILDKKYPLPKPIEVIQDTESKEKLLEAQSLIIKLQQENARMASENATAAAIKLLLEDREEQLKIAQEQVSILQNQLDEARERQHQAELQSIADQAEKSRLEQEIGKYHKTFFGLYKKKD